MKRTLFTCLSISVSVVLAVSPAQADESASVARQLLKEGKIMPLQEILTKAKVIKPGQVIETDLEKDDGRYIYELEILDEQGQVWELELDAQTGEFIELENEDN
ncbi:PepSY domain-containing protein [Methylophaga thalassica]|uniref:PepSY domain-containing protein n=1 Tax=Methylophaga thalassica TaxID=40223 RepID=UPI002548E9B4|nr:PepSY domain-containing protein [Methylophaga thalassica]